MINTSIESGHVPGTMKLAKVIPIYKSKDRQMLNNYRPISLLPIFSKIIEKVIYQRLFNFLNTNNALFSSQYGFRKNHSTINAVTELVSHVSWSTNDDITDAHISATIQQILTKFSAVVSYVKQRQIGKFQLICT